MRPARTKIIRWSVPGNLSIIEGSSEHLEHHQLAASIMSISYQPASSASAGVCRESAKPSSEHHEHQLQSTATESFASSITSISLNLPAASLALALMLFATSVQTRHIKTKQPEIRLRPQHHRVESQNRKDRHLNPKHTPDVA